MVREGRRNRVEVKKNGAVAAGGAARGIKGAEGTANQIKSEKIWIAYQSGMSLSRNVPQICRRGKIRRVQKGDELRGKKGEDSGGAGVQGGRFGKVGPNP